MAEHEQKEICSLQFKNVYELIAGLKEEMKEMREREESKGKELNEISKAIIAIQVASENTAKTLEKFEEKMNQALTQKISFWNTDAGKQIPKYAFFIIALVILGLIGSNAIETLKAVNAVVPLK